MSLKYYVVSQFDPFTDKMVHIVRVRLESGWADVERNGNPLHFKSRRMADIEVDKLNRMNP